MKLHEIDEPANREDSFEEFANFILNEVSDEKIEDLFAQMGIDIDLKLNEGDY